MGQTLNRARVGLRVMALGFLGFGAWAFVSPAGLLAYVGTNVTDAAGLAEVRAYYGGLELGFAIYLWWASLRPERMHAAALAATSIYAGCAIGRWIGLVITPSANVYVILSGAGETAGALAGLWLARSTRPMNQA